jgi:subtilisin
MTEQRREEEVEGHAYRWDQDTEATEEDQVADDTCSGTARPAPAPSARSPPTPSCAARVLGRRLTGKGVMFAAGLRWAIANRMQVINLSLSTDKREYFALFHELVDQAYFANVVLVCAVNNVPGPTYPSKYAARVLGRRQRRHRPLPLRLQPGPTGPVRRPRHRHRSPWLGGSTVKATGNSFTAPHIAGLVARILGNHSGLTPFQVKTILLALASNAAGRSGRSERTGNPRGAHEQATPDSTGHHGRDGRRGPRRGLWRRSRGRLHRRQGHGRERRGVPHRHHRLRIHQRV